MAQLRRLLASSLVYFHPERVVYFPRNIHYRTCDGLLRLHRITEPEKFARVCRIALEHRICSYKVIQKILENNMALHMPGQDVQQPLPAHGNIRGKEYYTQSIIDF